MTHVGSVQSIPATMSNIHEISVIAYDGYKANQRPVAVFYDGERLDVREVEDSWTAAGIDPRTEIVTVFKVKCERGMRFKLTYGFERGWTGEVLPGSLMVDE